MSRLTGTVKWFDTQKGFGFITADGKDYFVHHSYLPEGMLLNEGDLVSFEPVQDDKGREQAKDLQLGAGEVSEESSPEPIEDDEAEQDTA